MQSMMDLSTKSRTKHITNSIENISKIFKNNKNYPLDTAIYWIEYVIKHNIAAPQLQSHAKNLPWYQTRTKQYFSFLKLSILHIENLIKNQLQVKCDKFICIIKSYVPECHIYQT